ncbi:MAG: hypothetical protein F6J93_02495 [Oscillatoria sp. SIO1A7]|nr:hypothetical protein [Oscillatoria sp. SIO1A7]
MQNPVLGCFAPDSLGAGVASAIAGGRSQIIWKALYNLKHINYGRGLAKQYKKRCL